MDKFVKYALITVCLMVAIMAISAYVGAVVFKGSMEGTDATVNDMAGEATTSWFNFPFTVEPLGIMGEYIGFSAAGIAGGFIVGYCYPTIFSGKTETAPRRKN